MQMRKKKCVFLVLDLSCVLFVLLLLLIQTRACQINIHSSPAEGVRRGSSYQPDAIGNPEWVEAHPGLAHLIDNSDFLPRLDVIAFWSSIPLLATGYYVIPLLCIAFLIWRAWVSRRWIPYAIFLASAAILVSATLPFIKNCVLVMMD